MATVMVYGRKPMTRQVCNVKPTRRRIILPALKNEMNRALGHHIG